MNRDFYKTGWLVCIEDLKVLQAALLRHSCLSLINGLIQLEDIL